MESAPQTYHLKVDSSGRILLPSDARERHRIANGDTVVVTTGREKGKRGTVLRINHYPPESEAVRMKLRALTLDDVDFRLVAGRRMIQCLRKDRHHALEFEPDSPAALWNLALAVELDGDLQEAA